MKVTNVFISINARDFVAQTAWWTMLIGRDPDSRPMKSCREWNLAPSVLFQVLDSPEKARVAVSCRIENLDWEIDRLRQAGVDVPPPVKVDGFDDLRLTTFTDPENNTVNLLEGS